LPSEKSARQARHRALQNRPIRRQARTVAANARQLIQTQELEQAVKAVGVAVSSLDKAVTKGILHHNAAARRKSRLMKGLNKAKGPASS